MVVLGACWTEECGDYAPIVGMVVTISPSFNLYRIVVFPAASRPTIRMRISFLPQRRSKSFENVRPILAATLQLREERWWSGRDGGQGRAGINKKAPEFRNVLAQVRAQPISHLPTRNRAGATIWAQNSSALAHVTVVLSATSPALRR